MILTVTPNPALDLTYRVDTLEHGESQRVAAARVRAGGKGLNVARVLHQLGAPVTAVAGVGGSTGAEFEAELVASGIPSRLIRMAAPTRRSMAIVDDGRRETTVLNEQGGPYDQADWARLAEELGSLLAGATCLTGSGSLPPGAPDSLYADLVSTAQAHGIPSVIDATGPALLHAAEAGATVLKPNRRELAESTGVEDPLAGAAMLLRLGASLVLVSLGEDGMIAVSASEPSTAWHARLPHVLDGNPTGAGDAAVAAAAVTLAEGVTDPGTILRRATAWSAAAVLMPQAGEIHPSYLDLEAQLTIDRG